MATEITFEGDVSEDDYRYMVEVHQVTNRTRRLLALFLLTALVLALLYLLGNLTGVLIGCAVVAICLIYIRFIWKRSYGKGYALLAKVFLELKGHLDQHGVKVVRSDSSISEFRWCAFTEFRKDDSRILLFLEGNTYLVLPKSMFTSEETWQAACSLVEAKLSSPISEGDEISPLPVNGGSSDDVTFSGEVSSNQLFFQHAFQIITNKYMYLLMFLISLPTLPFLLLRNPIADFVVVCIIGALPVLLLGITFLSCYVFDKNRQQREKILRGSLTADDIDLQFSCYRTYRPLRSYANYQRVGNLLYLYYTTVHSNVLHRDMFHSDGDWEQALTYISSTIPDKNSPEPEKPPVPPNCCSECGKRIGPDNTVQFGDQLVCAECKPRVVQKIKEGVYGRENEGKPSSAGDNP